MKALLAMVVSMFVVGCASAPRSADPGFSDGQIEAMMERAKVVGLALAVIDDGQVVKVAAYGKRNLEKNLPLQPDTVMYGASLTKTAFAYMVLQLASEGRLDLDAPLPKLLPKPLPDYRGEGGTNKRADFSDLAGDERWRRITPRILLTHSSGFANFRWLEPDKRLRFHFTPGERYAYSAEGMYILQLIVEQGLVLDAGREMQARVFDRLGMPNTSMQWRPDFAANLADGYTMEGRMESHDERSSVTAAGSMDTTIADQARMWAGILRGDGLTPAVRADMVRPQLPITSAGQFPTLVSRPGALVPDLAAGLGVVTFKDRSGPGWFKGGHNDSTGNMAICLEQRRRCVVMLSNDVRAERLFPDIARLALGENDMPWRWEYDWYGGTPQP